MSCNQTSKAGMVQRGGGMQLETNKTSVYKYIYMIAF